MDIVTVLQILRRRWMVFGGALLVTVVTAVLLARLDTAVYAADGSVVMVRGSGAATEGAENADPALQQTARLLAEVASGGEATRGLVDAAAVSVVVDPELPILRVTATDGNGANAVRTVEEVVAGLTTQLEELAAGNQIAVPDGTSMRQLVPPTPAEPQEDPEAQEGAQAPPTFVSGATLLLARGNASDDAVTATGVIDPSHTERFATSVVFERFADDAIQQQMQDQGATADIELEFDEDNPIIRVQATSRDRQEALTTGQVAVDTLQSITTELQEADDIPTDLRFRMEALAYPMNPYVFDSATLRTVIAVLALGLLASIGVALMVDAAASRRLLGRPGGAGGTDLGVDPFSDPWATRGADARRSGVRLPGAGAHLAGRSRADAIGGRPAGADREGGEMRVATGDPAAGPHAPDAAGTRAGWSVLEPQDGSDEPRRSGRVSSPMPAAASRSTEPPAERVSGSDERGSSAVSSHGSRPRGG